MAESAKKRGMHAAKKRIRGWAEAKSMRPQSQVKSFLDF